MNGPNKELMAQYGTDVLFREKTAEGTPFAAKMLFALTAMHLSRAFAEQQAAQREQAMAMNDRFQEFQAQQLGPTLEAVRHSRPKTMVGPMLEMGGPRDPNALEGMPLGWDDGMVRTAVVARLAGADMAKLALGPGEGLQALQKGLGSLFQGGMRAAGRNTGKAINAVKAVPGKLVSKAEGVGQRVGGALGNLGQRAEQAGARMMNPASAVPKQTPYRAPAPAVSESPSSGPGMLKRVGHGAALAGALGVGAAGLGAYALAKPAIGYLSKEQQTPTYGATAQGAPQLAYGVNQWGQPQLGAPFIQ